MKIKYFFDTDTALIEFTSNTVKTFILKLMPMETL